MEASPQVRLEPNARGMGIRRAAVPIVLLLIGIGALCLYLAAAVIYGPFLPGTVLRTTLFVAYLGAGTLAWLRRPEYLTGRLMVLAAFLLMVPTLRRFDDNGALFAIGSTLAGLEEAVLGYLLLTYPSGRPGPGIAGIVAKALAVFAFPLGLADLLTRETAEPPCRIVRGCTDEPNPFLIVDLGSTAAQFSVVVIGIVGVLVLALVVRRYLGARGAARRMLAPVLFAGVLAVLLVVLRQFAFYNVAAWLPLDLVAGASQTLIPLALGIGFLRSRMARAAVADLVVRAGREPSLVGLEASVRRTLHDPTARLARWSESTAAYLDAEGRQLETGSTQTQEVTRIDGSRGRLAAMAHDPVLAEEGDLLPSVVAAVRVVLENEDLANSLQAQTADAARLPTGRVTLLHTDIEGSTELLDALREQYAPMLSELRHLLRAAVRSAGGTEIDSRADEFFAAIPDPAAAVTAAIDIQRELAGRTWPAGHAVRVRIGLHTGEPDRTAEGYVGMDVHLAARVGAAGHGGQIVASDSTRAAVGADDSTARFRDLGLYRLKGIPLDVRLYQVDAVGDSPEFPPLRGVPV
ncbi:MAG TPA: adenylate/guanylate cyclase domain-containing protein [Glaciibacter sp.]|nr:adenylate/guanylate cyclase domain-containing protein [Glaciibacter sp.]